MRTFRVHRGILQTPVSTWRSSRTDHSVTVISVCYIGAAAYYDAVCDLAAARQSEGAAVLLGFGQIASAEEWEAATSEQRTAREYFSATAYGDAVAGHLGWVRDRKLHTEPSWVDTGLTDLEMINMKGPQAVIDEYKGEIRLAEALGAERTGQLGAALMAVGFRAMSLPRRVHGPARAAAPRGRPDIDGRRNAQTLAALPDDRDAVVIWSAGDLRSLASTLQSHDYELSTVGWLNCGRVPPLRKSILPVLRSIFLRVQVETTP